MRRLVGPPLDGIVHIRTELALFVPEADNPHDSNAVAVHIADECVGYLSRTDAKRLGPALTDLCNQGKPVGCKAEIRGSDPLGVALYFDPDQLTRG
ncbi:MAG: HIRAN domain-containing protein [Actinomycetota bacterium]